MTQVVQKRSMTDYLYIAGTILCTVYGQVILKWRINMKNLPVPDGGGMDKFLNYYYYLLIDPFIISGFVAAFVASLFWMAAMSKFELSFAYPFTVLSPALVFILGIWLFDEAFTLGKVAGLFLIIVGLIITVKF